MSARWIRSAGGVALVVATIWGIATLLPPSSPSEIIIAAALVGMAYPLGYALVAILIFPVVLYLEKAASRETTSAPKASAPIE